MKILKNICVKFPFIEGQKVYIFINGFNVYFLN